ncbi:MAG: hypothetical protein JNM89_01595 [Hyphomicrobiaceae bacterium]|nr:hypothetical protein [Hyphomicrobiaceae bacterium]
MMRRSGTKIGALWSILALGLAVLVAPVPAHADKMSDEFRRTLNAKETAAFDAWRAAQLFHSVGLDAYWGKVEKKRSGRKAKKQRGRPLTAADYVAEHPPKYEGPSLSVALARKWKEFREQREAKEPPPPPSDPIATVADFLDSARRNYGFEPEIVPEPVFKERYAAEAMALGLRPDQVLRVYALETGGLGTADMQAGVHPISRKGTPISTALGYAQLLAANSVNELSKSGPDMLARLRAMIRRTSPEGERHKRLEAKLQSLERMVQKARAVPYQWSRHVAFANTDVGRGIHAINLDGDIGPWLQIIKLKGLAEMAAEAGRGALSGAEFELMNLAGPGTGLEMMTPAGMGASTTNFFARAAYYRNTIVREKTSSELLVAIDKRMEANLKNSGAVEFAEIFSRLQSRQRAGGSE